MSMCADRMNDDDKEPSARYQYFMFFHTATFLKF